MIGVELAKDEKLTPAASEAEAFATGCCRQGVLVGVGGATATSFASSLRSLLLRPQIDRAIVAFAAALQEVAQPARCSSERQTAARVIVRITFSHLFPAFSSLTMGSKK